MKTVTVRMVGSTLVSRMGGDTVLVSSPELAAEMLLRNQPVRIPGGLPFVNRVRKLIALHAVNGSGPEEAERIWSGRELLGDTPGQGEGFA